MAALAPKNMQLTPEQSARVIMTREWLDNGVTVALGSAAPTTPWLQPQMTLAASLVRQTASGQVMGPYSAPEGCPGLGFLLLGQVVELRVDPFLKQRGEVDP